MNRKKVYSAIFAMSLCLCGSMFVACDDDDNNTGGGDVLTAGAVVGEYPDAVMTAGEADTTVTVTVGADSVSIADFPVDGIVAAVVPAEQLSEALASVGSVPFSASYKGSVVGNKVAMTVSADSPLFNTTADGQEHTVKVGFTQPASGEYSGADSTLTMKVEAATVIFDGDTLTDFAPIEYELKPAHKAVVAHN